jgi:hypothetical protein
MMVKEKKKEETRSSNELSRVKCCVAWLVIKMEGSD